MKKVGVIGGIAPLSTGYFYQSLVNMCRDRLNSLYPNVLINSVETWEFTKSLAEPKKTEMFFIKEIEKLHNNVDFIVIVCNTAHFVLKEIKRFSKVPIIPIYEEVIRKVKEANIKKVGILGTQITISSGMYTKELEKQGINYDILDIEEEAELNRMTYNEIPKNNLGKETYKRIKSTLIKNIRSLAKKGCDGVILGCTEYPVFVSQKDVKGIKVFSSTDILAESVIDNLKEPSDMKYELLKERMPKGKGLFRFFKFGFFKKPLNSNSKEPVEINVKKEKN